MKTKYAIRTVGGGLIHRNEVVTEGMRHFIRVNPTAQIVKKSKSKKAINGWLNIK
jgi:hypothetical protein